MSQIKDQFYKLTPEATLKSVEIQGFQLTGRYTQLNSYENRVFSFELEEDMGEIIGKFYRPGRWSKDAILEEHSFIEEIAQAGIPAVKALKLKNKSTLFQSLEIWSCLFPKQKGRIPQELSLDELKQIGRLLARMHNIGSQKEAKHRPFLDTETYGDQSLEKTESLITPEVRSRYLKAADNILNFLDERLNDEIYLRIHGDCHKGNLLQTDPVYGPKEFFFVDFDDFCNGPAVYDFWMLFSGDNKEKEIESILTGYTELRHFNPKSLEIIDALRGLRMIYYSGWIARRWSDPSFKKLFPNYLSYNYWAEETEALEQIAWSL